jgi:predicted dehydrogenase
MMLRLGLVGCGGMGRRHIGGLARLREIGQPTWDLAGVCDLFPQQASQAADLAAEVLGRRPDTFGTLAEMQAACSLDAIIVTTMPDLHAAVGIEACELGLHVMVEKPIALTVAQGAALVEAAGRTGRKLAVAENYRRDPVNRLAKALLDAGLIGPLHLFVQSSSGSGERVIITPWRHRKQSGGIVVDMGIHYADLLEYFAGPIDQVFGFNGIVDEHRFDATGTPHPVDAEDLSVGVARFRSGAIGNWVIDLAGRGQGHFSRVAYGRSGSLAIPPDRTGRALELTIRRDGVDMPVSPAEQLDLVPDFRLDPVTAHLFGGERLATYDLPFATTDTNLLAIEQADFAAAISEDRPPEVDGAFGLRSLAIAYGFLEAERLGRALTVDEILTTADLPYQSGLA